MLLPQTYALVRRADISCAFRLNQIIGKSPVFDRLLTYVADEDGRERLYLLVLIFSGIHVWRAKNRRDRGRRLSMLLFIACIVGGAILFERALDESYMRSSPSYVIRPFRNIKDIYKWDIDVKDHRSFPSSEGMVLLLAGFLMLRMRARWAWMVLLAGLTLPIGGCMVGRTWVSDLYLGALPMSFLVSALAMQTFVGKLHTLLYEQTLAVMDHAHIYWRRYKYVLRPAQVRNSRNVFTVEATVKQYLIKGLPVALGHPELRPEHVEAPLGGRRTLVRVVTFRGQKLLLRAYPVGTHHEAEVHHHAAQLLEEHGVRVPHVIHHTEQPFRGGVVFLVEEYVEGRLKWGEELTDAELQLMARQVARLHSISSLQWGPLLAPRSEDFADVMQRRVQRRIDRLVQQEVLADGEEARRLRDWFTEKGQQLRELKSYALTHGQLHRDNMMFTRSGEFVLFDYATLEYAAPQTDIVYLHYHLLDEDPRLTQAFDDYYLAELPESQRQQFAGLFEYFKAVFYLGRLSTRWKRHRRRGAGDEVSTRRVRESHHLETLRQIIGG
jgi:aminoglycoside phosphotransferase (APT) family kinase protein